MRILVAHPGPDFSVADVHQGWVKALTKQGHQVKVYDTNHRLSFYGSAHVPDWNAEPDENGERPFVKAMDDQQAMLASMQGLSHEMYTFWPRVVVFVSAFYTSAQQLEVIRSRGHKVVLIHTESPYQDDEQLMRAQFASLNLLNDPHNVQDYQDLAPSLYIPHAYDPEVHYPRKGAYEEDVKSDFAFIGTMFESRRKFFEQMLSHKFLDYHVLLGGAGWEEEHLDDSPLLRFLGHPRGECVDNSETARAYRNSRAGINFYRRESEPGHEGEGWAMGPREIEMAACELPFARDPRPESDEVFPFLPAFSSPEEAADILLWMLRNENQRQDLAEQARAAIADRTFDNNAAVMMRELEKQGMRL
jgi:glycosyltransferase involved in cell wall biosynthesis